MKKLKFIVFEKPLSQNQVYKVSRKGMYMTEAGKSYKNTIGWQAKDAMMRQKVSMFTRPRISFVFKWNDNKIHDIDNPIKLTLDALKGICFPDDHSGYVRDLNIKVRDGRESICIIITE